MINGRLKDWEKNKTFWLKYHKQQTIKQNYVVHTSFVLKTIHTILSVIFKTAVPVCIQHKQSNWIWISFLLIKVDHFLLSTFLCLHKEDCYHKRSNKMQSRPEQTIISFRMRTSQMTVYDCKWLREGSAHRARVFITECFLPLL